MKTERPRVMAAELLLRQRLRSLFIDVTKLWYNRPVLFQTYGEFCRETRMTLPQLRAQADLRDGCMVRRDRNGVSVCVVLYNEAQKNMRRRNFTLAHEIGHIYLEHGQDGPKDEAEADAFAAELLMPSALVQELAWRRTTPLTWEDLCEVFAVSRRAADNRLRKMDKIALSESVDFELVKNFGKLLPNIDGPVISI